MLYVSCFFMLKLYYIYLVLCPSSWTLFLTSISHTTISILLNPLSSLFEMRMISRYNVMDWCYLVGFHLDFIWVRDNVKMSYEILLVECGCRERGWDGYYISRHWPIRVKEIWFSTFSAVSNIFLCLKIKNKIKIKHISNHQKFIWFFQKMNHDSNMQISQGELENVLKMLHE